MEKKKFNKSFTERASIPVRPFRHLNCTYDNSTGHTRKPSILSIENTTTWNTTTTDMSPFLLELSRNSAFEFFYCSSELFGWPSAQLPASIKWRKKRRRCQRESKRGMSDIFEWERTTHIQFSSRSRKKEIGGMDNKYPSDAFFILVQLISYQSTAIPTANPTNFLFSFP